MNVQVKAIITDYKVIPIFDKNDTKFTMIKIRLNIGLLKNIEIYGYERVLKGKTTYEGRIKSIIPALKLDPIGQEIDMIVTNLEPFEYKLM